MPLRPDRAHARLTARTLVGVTGVVVLMSAANASAQTPEGWERSEPVSALSTLVLLVGVPLGLFLLIALAVYVPSMVRGQRYTPGLAWHRQNEWFGGPSGGLEAADSTDRRRIEAGSEPDRGGASARW